MKRNQQIWKLRYFSGNAQGTQAWIQA